MTSPTQSTSNSIFKGKTVLITGGTGSFGSTFAGKLLADDECSKVIIFSRDEMKQWEMQQSSTLFNHPKIRYFLGDVRDRQRLMRAFKEVNIVVHAAALKQVPAAEYNPSEFVQTNIMGAMNIIDAAIDCGVEHVMALSSDKAVNPVNLYGATKLCSDKLFVSGNSYVGARGYPKLSVVRYGNVVASRGSIVPRWRKMIANGATSLPVTDIRMTRFWMTLDQSVKFVQDSCAMMVGGEIFVPKIPSINIVDLASALAHDLPMNIIGIRPGEKLHELLINSDEARHSFESSTFFVVLPEGRKGQPTQQQKLWQERAVKPLSEGYVYASNTNSHWLSVDELRQLLLSSV